MCCLWISDYIEKLFTGGNLKEVVLTGVVAYKQNLLHRHVRNKEEVRLWFVSIGRKNSAIDNIPR